MSCRHGNWSDCDECAEELANTLLVQNLEGQIAELAAAQKDAKQREDLQDVVSKALCRAWQLGQDYWAQADSESYSQNKRADETHKKFMTLIDTTLEAMKGK